MTATSSNELFQVKIGNYLSYTKYLPLVLNQLEFYIQEKSEPIKIPIYVFVSQLWKLEEGR